MSLLLKLDFLGHTILLLTESHKEPEVKIHMLQ